jgi:hypothetical protein
VPASASHLALAGKFGTAIFCLSSPLLITLRACQAIRGAEKQTSRVYTHKGTQYLFICYLYSYPSLLLLRGTFCPEPGEAGVRE